MPFLRAQVRLPRQEGIAEDDVINVWHFLTGGTVADGAAAVVTRLTTFYNSIESYMSRVLTGVIDVKVYDLEDPTPRPVEHQQVTAFQPAAVSHLPAELAAKITLVGVNPDINVPVQYRRGGVYLGPLNVSVMENIGPGQSDETIVPAFRTLIATNVVALSGLSTSNDPRVAVYSPTWHKGRGPTSGGAPGGRPPLPALDDHPLGSSVFPAATGWVDNAFDIQRRRGSDATARTTFVFPA